jgi:hypothetical protein
MAIAFDVTRSLEWQDLVPVIAAAEPSSGIREDDRLIGPLWFDLPTAHRSPSSGIVIVHRDRASAGRH